MSVKLGLFLRTQIPQSFQNISLTNSVNIISNGLGHMKNPPCNFLNKNLAALITKIKGYKALFVSHMPTF